MLHDVGVIFVKSEHGAVITKLASIAWFSVRGSLNIGDLLVDFVDNRGSDLSYGLQTSSMGWVRK
jgi:hypothetical protein